MPTWATKWAKESLRLIARDVGAACQGRLPVNGDLTLKMEAGGPEIGQKGLEDAG